MSRSIRDQAGQNRVVAVAELLRRKGITKSTIDRVAQIDSACAQIDRRGQPFTIKNVVRALQSMYPNSAPAESSIRNRTLAGDTYRGVIDAWRTYRLANSPVRSSTSAADADISDGMLNEIRPDSARLLVLMMRTALRNMRRQNQILQAGFLSMPAIATSDSHGHKAHRADQLAKRQIDSIRALLDAKECLARRISWNAAGQLLDDAGNALSRPGLREALEHVVHR